jgi:branched-chain amino acid transport system ATP-binding protein
MTGTLLRLIWERIFMLRVEDIDVSYGDVQALWGVTLYANDGEIVALVGSNGAGKTTVLKTVAGTLRPKKGSVILDKKRLDVAEAHEIVQLGISLVPEGRRLFRDMTVLENLELGGYIDRARKLKEQNLRWAFHIFPILEQRWRQPAGTLSGGEQQMLAIARGLMSEPKLLLVDELSLGLGPLIVKNIYKTLKEINKSRNVGILVVEQNVRLALEVANRGYVIQNGRITMDGEGRELLASEEIKSAYLSVG